MAKKKNRKSKKELIKDEKEIDEDDFELDFSSIKNFFSKKNKEKKEKEVKKNKKSLKNSKTNEGEDDDFELDFSEVKNWFIKNKKFTYPLSIAFLILIVCSVTWTVRTQSVANLQGKYLLGLDPYIFYRYAEYIVNGNLPFNDTLRYYPHGFQTNRELLSPSYATAVVYFASNFLGFNLSVMDSAIIFPAVATVIAMIFFFLFVKEVFKSNKIAFISSMLLSVISGFLFRTSAGFTDKESVAMVFVFGMLFFVSKALKQEKPLKQIIYSVFSGLFLIMSALSWGGVNIVLIPLGLTFILSIFFKISKRKDSIFYLILTLAIFSITFITPRYGQGIDVLENMMFICIPIAFLLNIYYYEIYPKISKFVLKYKPEKMHEHYYILLVGLIALVLITPFFPGIDFYEKIFNFIQHQFLTPMGGDAFSRSVSENQQPYFISSNRVDWWSGLNYVFYTMIIGSFFLFYDMLKKFPKQRLIYSIIYLLIILAFIFSRFSDAQEYSTITEFFSSRILGLEIHYLFLIAFLIFTIYFLYKNNKRVDDFSKIKIEYLFLFIWFFLSIVVARGAVRLIFMVCPVAAIMSGYAFEKLSAYSFAIIKNKFISYCLIAGIAIIFTSIFMFNYNISYNSNKNFYSSFTYEWDEAMQWVRENTAEDSVFTHWWDYGYWVQAMGQRATTLDGGNYDVGKNHMIGRYLFASQIFQNDSYNMSEPATYLLQETNNPNYFLIIDDDVLKFVQMGRIGKKPVFYTVGGFSEEIKNELNLENSSIFSKLLLFRPYYSYYPVQEDFVYNNFIFKKDSTFILNIIYPYNPANGEISAQAYAHIYNHYYPGNQLIIPFNGNCIKNQGCFNYRNDGLKEYPLLMNDGVVLITQNATNNLFTHLYLLNLSIPGINLAYTNERELTVQGMVSQGITDIKIFEFDYDELSKWVLNETLLNYWTVDGDAFW